MRKLIMIIRKTITSTAIAFLTCSFIPNDAVEFKKLEQLALHESIVGKEYVRDITGISHCNKSKVKYLGIAKTKKGKSYKIITSFFVYKTTLDNCRGASYIKIYNLQNRFIGQYYVGMPQDLPDVLKQNKLLYIENSSDCNQRNKRIIDLNNGLPKSFFIPCSENGGDSYSFDSGS